MDDRKVKKRRLLWAVRELRAHVNRMTVCRNTTVVAITGSCAKTSTTRLLSKIISDVEPCHIGIDANTQMGVVRNTVKLKREHRFFVQETGVSAQGEMRRMAALLRADIAIVTTIGQDHYTSFRTLEAVAEEKGRLVEMLSGSGVAVLNADDPHVASMAERTRARVITYGLSSTADVRGSQIQSQWPDRLSLTVTYQGESVRVKTGLFGDLLVTAVLAAIASALAAGFNLQQCAQSLEGVEAFERRMSIHPSPAGVWFVSDTFKAPFWSVEKVVALFEHAMAPRKTLVFGSFSDTTGSDSPKYRTTARAALVVADRVVFIGKKARYIHKMMSPETDGRLFVFDTPEEAFFFLADNTLKDELVLIKSNNLEHLERLIHGQDVELNCWEQRCPKMMSCHQCAESGLAGREGSNDA